MKAFARATTVMSQRGVLQGVLAYALWGIVPLYWKALDGVPAAELIAHRVLWGVGAFAIFVVAAGQTQSLLAALRQAKLVAIMGLSGSVLAVNWGVFVWATTSGHLLDASLGYFINPLVSIALGMLVLRERLRPLQWIAIALAATGVAVLAWRGGHVPWTALVLAFSFGVYGLIRKIAKVDALVGSAIETILLAPVAVVYLGVLGSHAAFGHVDMATNLLLIGTGVVTAVPLVLFTSAARELPLTTVGFLQYLAPTGQFLVAKLVFHERLANAQLGAFALIWVGLAVFSVDLWRRVSRGPNGPSRNVRRRVTMPPA
jgi:chloramphenicol-sensitive protein RarD